MLRTILAVLPIVTAGFYLLGATFHQGFLGAFGIEETLFPISVDRTLFEGFVAFITLSAKPLVYLLVAVFGVCTTAMIAAILSSQRRVRSWVNLIARKIRAKQSRASTPETHITLLAEKLSVALIYVAGGFLIYVILLFVGLASTKSGQAEALRFVQISTENKDGFAILYPAPDSPSLTGKPIYCSTSHCAYWLGSEVIILRHELVAKIAIPPSSISKELRDKASQHP